MGLTAEETEGGAAAAVDEVRAAEVERILNARAKVVDARVRQKERNKAKLQKEVMDDPLKWSCPQCYIDDSEAVNSLPMRDVFNKSTARMCYKCNADRPVYGALENIRWKCPTCCYKDDLSWTGAYDFCQICKAPYDKESCDWWYMPDPPDDSGGGGVQARKKPRTRGGKRHRKGVPQSSDPRHEPDADADTSGDEQHP